jgi:hypothetical protein
MLHMLTAASAAGGTAASNSFAAALGLAPDNEFAGEPCRTTPAQILAEEAAAQARAQLRSGSNNSAETAAVTESLIAFLCSKQSQQQMPDPAAEDVLAALLQALQDPVLMTAATPNSSTGLLEAGEEPFRQCSSAASPYATVLAGTEPAGLSLPLSMAPAAGNLRMPAQTLILQHSHRAHLGAGQEAVMALSQFLTQMLQLGWVRLSQHSMLLLLLSCVM